MICYVGVSIDPPRRYKNHLRPMAWESSRASRWVKELKKFGTCPAMTIVGQCKRSEIVHFEQDAIAMVRAVHGEWCLNDKLKSGYWH